MELARLLASLRRDSEAAVAAAVADAEEDFESRLSFEVGRATAGVSRERDLFRTQLEELQAAVLQMEMEGEKER